MRPSHISFPWREGADQAADAGWGRHGGFGPGPGFGPGFPPGFGPGHGFGPGFGRGGRGRGGRARGDVRAAILALLAEQPRHGYDIIRAIEERSAGAWTPSAGSIYPTLQVLEDEGLVVMATLDGRRTASLTDEGRAQAEAQVDAIATLFDATKHDDAMSTLRREMGELRDAAIHVARRSDDKAKVAKAAEIIGQARRDLYRLLAEDDA